MERHGGPKYRIKSAESANHGPDFLLHDVSGIGILPITQPTADPYSQCDFLLDNNCCREFFERRELDRHLRP